jgi:hypothetical protein
MMESKVDEGAKMGEILQGCQTCIKKTEAHLEEWEPTTWTDLPR